MRFDEFLTEYFNKYPNSESPMNYLLDYDTKEIVKLYIKSGKKQIEKEEQTIYNVFPMRNDIIPHSIKLDTTTLVHLLFAQKQGNKTDYKAP